LIKQYVAGMVGLVMCSSVWAESTEAEAAALAGLTEVQKMYENRPQGTPNDAGTRTLTKKDINDCVVQMTEAKNKLDAVKQQYSSTKAYQSMQTRMLTGQVRGRLATCKQTKDTLGY
jgi:ribosomal protein S12 methylthiotransferase accessory factor YcaO